MNAIGRWGLLLALAVGVGSVARAVSLRSPEFADGRAIPERFTCAGADVSPALRWAGAPAGTKSFALVCEDPDAPGGLWVHWVIYNLPAALAGLPEKIPATKSLANGASQGLNSFRKIGYNGPCPPAGEKHRYVFRLYAADRAMTLPPGGNRAELLEKLKGHILATAETVGTYAAK